MLALLKRLFGGTGCNRLVVDAFWCDSSVKLPNKVQTPMGSNVTVVNVCVDVHYSIDGGNIILHRVRLSHGGGRITGLSTPINVASDRTGEAWYASYICPESYLVEAIQEDLSSADSRLRKIMMRKWGDVNRDVLVQSLADFLNTHAPPDQIARLIAAAGRGNDIVFTYTKARGNPEARHVFVQGASGNSIRARDHKDDKVKNFRIDRIANARNA